MRGIQIGERGLQSMTEDELIVFLNKFGYCSDAASWGMPVITYFSYDDGAIYFDFYQKKHIVKKIMGHIFLKEDSHGQMSFGIYLKIEEDRHISHEFGILKINHFLSLGFNLPLGETNIH